jgi:hypothetical protein
MHFTGAKRMRRRLAATTGMLLILAATAAGADSLDTGGDGASASSSQVPLLAAAVGSGVGEVSLMPAAPPLIDAAAVAADRAAERLRDGDAPVGQGDEALGFLDQLVTQYFESYN